MGLQRALTSSRTSPSPPSTTARSTSTPINGATTPAGVTSGSCNTTQRAKQRGSPWCLKSTARRIQRTTRKSAHLGNRPCFKTPVWPTTPSGSLGPLCPLIPLMIMPFTTTRRPAVITMFWRTSTRQPCWLKPRLRRSKGWPGAWGVYSCK